MSERFEGYADRECGEHRTLGGRAWCYACTEYCYPRTPCMGCEIPALHSEVDDHKRFIAALHDDLALAIAGRDWLAVARLHVVMREHLQAINGPDQN